MYPIKVIRIRGGSLETERVRELWPVEQLERVGRVTGMGSGR
jgi:hypothetical protein